MCRTGSARSNPCHRRSSEASHPEIVVPGGFYAEEGFQEELTVYVGVFCHQFGAQRVVALGRPFFQVCLQEVFEALGVFK